jgi:hypothetical protein
MLRKTKHGKVPKPTKLKFQLISNNPTIRETTSNQGRFHAPSQSITTAPTPIASKAPTPNTSGLCCFAPFVEVDFAEELVPVPPTAAATNVAVSVTSEVNTLVPDGPVLVLVTVNVVVE